MRALFLLAAVWGGFFFGGPASAEPFCGRRTEIGASLGRDYAEAQVGRGLTAGGRLVELFVSPEGTFPILVTIPAGLSCVVAVGRNWDAAAKPAPTSPLSPDSLH